jgi:hypothetical protein
MIIVLTRELKIANIFSRKQLNLIIKVGHSYNNLNRQGGHEGNRRYCHATLDTLRIYRWDVTMNGEYKTFFTEKNMKSF